MSDIENRHLFAVITARASACEQKELLDGIISKGLKMNTDIVAISNIYNASQYNDFITMEDNIYSMINSGSPEGFIITGDAFINPRLLEKVLSYLDKRDIPVVCSGSITTRYPSADSCTVSDFEQLTDHLVDIHHFSHIDILTGPVNLATSHDRVRGYQKSMEKHGLHTDENNIIYGDFWTTSGENTALSYINGLRKMPEAVICANDYMAFAMCDTFVAHGVRIPDDITVVGYEYVEGRTDHYPLLTTYERNRRALGEKMFDMLYERVTGKCPEKNISLEGRIITGDTCPCGSDYTVICSEIFKNHRQQFFSAFNNTGMLEQLLTNSKTIYDLINELKNHSYFLPDVSGMFLCLNEDWCICPEIKHRNISSDMICYSIIDLFMNNLDPIHFCKADLLPDFIRTDNKPNSYFCFPLFFMDRDFGFMTFRYDTPTNPGEPSVSWVKIISNALEFLRMKNDIDYLMQCRNLSELHDSATGLYNRTGLTNELGICIRNAGNISDIVIVLFTLNCESKISDSEYIFEKTSFLTDTAEVFRSFAQSPGKICGRIEKNVFAVAVTDHNGCNGYECQIADRIETMMYGCFKKHKIYGPDFSAIISMSVKITASQCSAILLDLQKRSESEISLINSRSDNPDYVKYCTLRNRNYINPFDIPDSSQACRLFCLSSGHFCAVYRQLFNNSYHQDTIIMRIRLAKYLLVSSAISIACIAEKCGYNNEKYFMQQFRLITGMTPNMYRKLKI